MTMAQRDFDAAARSHKRSEPHSASDSPRYKTTRDCPRVTLRLSQDDYERLQELADGMALSCFIRAKALGDAPRKSKRRSKPAVADHHALAQILGLLGQSRIANNLNQLAYHANIGALPVDDQTRGQIEETYDHVLLLRDTLMRALGHRR